MIVEMLWVTSIVTMNLVCFRTSVWTGATAFLPAQYHEQRDLAGGVALALIAELSDALDPIYNEDFPSNLRTRSDVAVRTIQY
jgi:hypothetical protein